MMKKLAISFILISALLLLIAPAPAMSPTPFIGGKIFVANRDSGTISVISVCNDCVIKTFPLLTCPYPPEPMYIVADPCTCRVFIGDRKNDCVAVLNSKTCQLETCLPVCPGVWHMWGYNKARQLWVTSDITKKISVFNMDTLHLLAIIPAPPDLVAMGGKPHDVVVDFWGCDAYVTFLGVQGDDYVVKYSTNTFKETARAQVGEVPHVSLNWWNGFLYLPCEGSNSLFILHKDDLSFEKELSIPEAHGAGMTWSGLFFYTSNITGGGNDAIFTLCTLNNDLVDGPVDAPFDTPHNIALTPSGCKLYLTHSGNNNTVSIYTTQGIINPVPQFKKWVTVGKNPFGLAWAP